MALCFSCQKRQGVTKTELFEAPICEVCARRYTESTHRNAPPLQIPPPDPDQEYWVLVTFASSALESGFGDRIAVTPKKFYIRVKETVYIFRKEDDAGAFLKKVIEVWKLPDSRIEKIKAGEIYAWARTNDVKLRGVLTLLPGWEKFFEPAPTIRDSRPDHVKAKLRQKLANPEAQAWLRRERERRLQERYHKKGLL